MGKSLTRPRQRLIAHRPKPTAPTPPATSSPKGSEARSLRVVPPDDVVDVNRVLDGCYDIPDLSFSGPPSILDVGAHVGAASAWFLARYPGCSIQAYEPHPAMVAAFQENLRDARWSVTLISLAVVGIGWPDLDAFLLDGLRGSWHRSVHQLGEQLTTGTKVATLRASELPEADILKLTTNGCELDILDSYPYLMKLRAVLLRSVRPSDEKSIVERLRASGLKLLRGPAPEMIFVRPSA